MARAKLNGIEIDYEVGGEGPAILLTHGFSATGWMWRPQRPAVEARFRLITWDLRGHGQTEAPAEPDRYGHDLAVGDMAALLDHVGERRAVIGGLSLGGYLSLRLYATYPQRVRALVICDSGPGYRNPASREAWNDRAERQAEDFERRGLASLEGRSPEMAQAIARHRSAEGLARAARGLLKQFDSRVIDLLPSVKVPTLVIVGDRDEAFLAPCRYMADKIPGARLEIIPGAGHASNLDQPERFNRALVDFLDSLPA